MIKPTIRFPEYTESYKETTLAEITDKVKRKNKENQTDIPLTIASVEGLVDQRTYFSKPIASKDMSNYYLLKRGEFAYNKSYSKGFPVGSVKRLDKYEQGALSTLYICFSLKPETAIDSDYLAQYFDSAVWHKSVSEICAEGARNHGLLNVSPDDFFSIGHYFAPTLEEQKKVAGVFSLLDRIIETQTEKISALDNKKRGIIQQILTQQIRIKDNNGCFYEKWSETALKDILTESTEKSSGTEEVYSVSVSKGLVNQVEHLGRSFAAEDTSNYNVVNFGDIVYTKSPTGEFKWGIVKQSQVKKSVIVSPFYGVFKPKSFEMGYIIDLYFSSSVRAHNYLITQIRKGAKNTINITNDEFLEKTILLPTSNEEARKIKDLVEMLESEINVENKKLDAIHQLKIGLQQRMFVNV